MIRPIRRQLYRLYPVALYDQTSGAYIMGFLQPAGWSALRPKRICLIEMKDKETLRKLEPEVGLTGRSYYGMGIFWTDYDNDGDPDLYVANDGHPNSLFRNDIHRLFVVALIESVAYSGDGRPQAGMGVAAGDYDRDGRFDIFVTNFRKITIRCIATADRAIF